MTIIKRLFSLLVTAFAIAMSPHSAMAQSFDLSNISSNGVYTMSVGGTPKDGVLERISITLPSYTRAVFFASSKGFDATNRLRPWTATDITEIYSSKEIPNTPQNTVFFMALELPNGEYLTIQPISAHYVTSWIEVKEKNRIDMVCGTQGVAEARTTVAPIFAYTRGTDLYGALYSMWNNILENDQVIDRTTLRMNKDYAELYEYLGWCSWEQYRHDINDSVLVTALDKLEQSKVPVRWILIDDGHQHSTINENRRGLLQSQLVDFYPSPKKFPEGWSNIMSKRSEKLKWMGLWHCMFGLWGGLSDDHNLPELTDYLMTNERRGTLVNDDDRGSKILYSKLINSMVDAGFDFTKIDGQTNDFTNYIGTDNPVVAHRQNAENVEAEFKGKLDGMMNCMAINLPCIFNTRYSATTRVSIDYKLNDLAMGCSHLYQGYQNSIWLGQTVWPDHDMFHSSDLKLGRAMAVSKAMSGAPVYLSDAPEDFLLEFIMPLTYSDGKLLRPLAPGVPTPNSLFSNSLRGTDTYSVIAPMTSHSAAIVVYNITNEESSKFATISEDDYKYADGMKQPYTGNRAIPKEGLAYYDWYNKLGGKLQEEYRFELKHIEDRIVLLTEIENGWSVIGREDKYLSTVVVSSYKSTKKSIDIVLYEAGPILVYSDKEIKSSTSGSVTALGNNIYRINTTSTHLTLQK